MYNCVPLYGGAEEQAVCKKPPMIKVYVFISLEYTIMAESLERCFSRALLKHFPSEDGDTDEEFHINSEEKERKDKKRNRNSKHPGPDTLIKATEHVQRKRHHQGGKGNTSSEEENSKPTRPHPPHWTNSPYHLQGLPPNQQHLHEEDMRGMYHPGQQVSSGYLLLFVIH